jgi:tRNA 2-selenouridine synthase
MTSERLPLPPAPVSATTANTEASFTNVEKRPDKFGKPGLIRLPLPWSALTQFDSIIDTRSPAEFALDHIPGAISCPVLNDEERIRVGTIYKQESAFHAKRVGASLVARNIGLTIEKHFHDKPKNWRPLIYCWRGGSRSGAMTHILRQVGWDATQLEGGYKAWRAFLVGDLATLAAQFQYVAITGRTGSGKSRLIEALTRAGAQVLDLEQLAAHKGSVLGNLPDRPQPSQKWFESAIWHQLSQFSTSAPVFVEAESKKVGMLRVPEALIERMWQGDCLDVQTADPLRVPLLKEEYAHLIANESLLRFKLDCLRPLHSSDQVNLWQSLIDQRDWDRLVASLLEKHYDPAYTRSMFQHYVNLPSAKTVVLDNITAVGFDRIAARTMSLFAAFAAPANTAMLSRE